MRTHINSNTLNPFDPNSLSEEYLDSCRKIWKRTRESNVPPIFTLKHLSLYLDVDYKYLHAICHRKHQPYSIKTITTASKNRTILIPEKKLKIIHKWILENILTSVTTSEASMAYEPGCSIKKNAEMHLESERKWFIKLDIKDYFPSIKEHQIFKIFNNLGYSELLSLEISRICTYENNEELLYLGIDSSNDLNEDFPYKKSNGYLPQGACVSPKLSNIFFTPIDYDISTLCSSKSLTYTRYADDLILSGDIGSYENCLLLINKVSSILRNYNLNLNKNKTRIVSPNGVKKVTGISINNKNLFPSKKIMNYISTSLYYIEKYGLISHIETSKTDITDEWLYKRHLMGKIFYVRSINKEIGDKFLSTANKLGLLE